MVMTILFQDSPRMGIQHFHLSEIKDKEKILS